MKSPFKELLLQRGFLPSGLPKDSPLYKEKIALLDFLSSRLEFTFFVLSQEVRRKLLFVTLSETNIDNILQYTVSHQFLPPEIPVNISRLIGKHPDDFRLIIRITQRVLSSLHHLHDISPYLHPTSLPPSPQRLTSLVPWDDYKVPKTHPLTYLMHLFLVYVKLFARLASRPIRFRRFTNWCENTLFRKGAVFLQQNKHHLASLYLTPASKFRPPVAAAAFNLAKLFEDLGQFHLSNKIFEDSIAYYGDTEDFDHNHAGLYYYKTLALIRTHRPDEAIHILKNIISLEPLRSELYFILAWLYFHSGDYDSSLATIARERTAHLRFLKRRRNGDFPLDSLPSSDFYRNIASIRHQYKRCIPIFCSSDELFTIDRPLLIGLVSELAPPNIRLISPDGSQHAGSDSYLDCLSLLEPTTRDKLISEWNHSFSQFSYAMKSTWRYFRRQDFAPKKQRLYRRDRKVSVAIIKGDQFSISIAAEQGDKVAIKITSSLLNTSGVHVTMVSDDIIKTRKTNKTGLVRFPWQEGDSIALVISDFSSTSEGKLPLSTSTAPPNEKSVAIESCDEFHQEKLLLGASAPSSAAKDALRAMVEKREESLRLIVRPFCSVNDKEVSWFRRKDKVFLVLLRLACQLKYGTDPWVNETDLCDTGAQNIYQLRATGLGYASFFSVDDRTKKQLIINREPGYYRLALKKENVHIAQDGISKFVPMVFQSLQKRIEEFNRCQQRSGEQYSREKAKLSSMSYRILRLYEQATDQRKLLVDTCGILKVNHQFLITIDDILRRAVELGNLD